MNFTIKFVKKISVSKAREQFFYEFYNKIRKKN